MRGPLAWPPVPAQRTRGEIFDEYVLDAVERIERRLPQGLGDVEFAVELIPPSDPSPWERQEPALSRLFPAEKGLPARIVLYRRPIETKVVERADLAVVVNDIVVEQLAAALGVDPTTLDPGFDEED